MPDNEMKDRTVKETKTPPKPAPKPRQENQGDEKPRHKLGLVEILIFLLLAGVVFIFVFGMQQMQREKKQEEALQAKFEEVLPSFEIIAKGAKQLKADDPFGDWPLSIDFIIEPAKVNTPEFGFDWLDTGVVVLTTTKEFGKEGIKVIYDVATDSYSIEDPEPTVKPVIKDSWLNQ